MLPILYQVETLLYFFWKFDYEVILSAKTEWYIHTTTHDILIKLSRLPDYCHCGTESMVIGLDQSWMSSKWQLGNFTIYSVLF